MEKKLVVIYCNLIFYYCILLLLLYSVFQVHHLTFQQHNNEKILCNFIFIFRFLVGSLKKLLNFYILKFKIF